MSEDPWAGRAQGMRCATCVHYVTKGAQRHVATTRSDGSPMVSGAGAVIRVEDDVTITSPRKEIGRCRRHAPTMAGFPIVYPADWCGDHRLDENKVGA